MANEVMIHVKAKDDASKTVAGIGANFKKLAVGAGVAALAVGAVLARAMAKASAAARESAKITAQTQAVIKSTGGAANITAKQVEGYATRLSKLTGVDDEVIQSGENMLLTFTNIRNDLKSGNMIFDEATKATLDLSVAMGKDMSQSAVMVGKALNDPVKGITALKRVGVTFNAEQEKTIKHLVKTGKVAEAQKVILQELRKEFGGSAEAQATWADKARVAAGNIEESFGELVNRGLEPVAKWFVNTGAPAIEGFFDKLVKNKELKRALGDLKETLKELGATDLSGFLDSLNEGLPEAVENINSLVTAYGKFARFIDKQEGGLGGNNILLPKPETVRKQSSAVLKALSSFVTGTKRRFGQVVDAGQEMVSGFRSVGSRVVGAVASMASRAVAALGRFASGARSRFNQVIAAGQRMVAGIRSGMSRFAAAVSSGASRAMAIITGLARRIRGAFAGAGSWLFSAGRNIVNGLVNGIKSAAGAVSSAVAGVVARARSAIGGAISAVRRATGAGLASGGYVGGLAHAAEGGPRGGSVLVGEHGPEIVNLPYGSHVNSNPDSMAKMGRGGRGGQSIHFHFHGPVYGDHAALQRALVDMKRRGQLEVVLR